MKNYLNHAGASIMSDQTFDIYINHLTLEREVGAYEAANKMKEKQIEFYDNAARLINAQSNQIAFVDSASRGWNLLVDGVSINKGAQILTLQSEFGTNLIKLYQKAEEISGELKVIPCDQNGNYSLSLFEEELIKGNVGLIAISHAAAHGAIVNDVIEIGKLAKKHNVLFIVDGCQSIGQVDVNVQEILCDAYVATGRKWLRGPRGTGFIFIKNEELFKATHLDLASADLLLSNDNNINGLMIRKDAKKVELWERNIAGMLSLSKAIEQCISISKSDFYKIQTFAKRIRKAVYENDSIELIGKVNSCSGIVGFYAKDISIENRIITYFKENGLEVSTMKDWDCPLHFPNNGIQSIFRISPHYFSDEKFINRVVEFIKLI